MENIIKELENLGYMVSEVNKNGVVLHGVSFRDPVGRISPIVYADYYIDRTDMTDSEKVSAIVEALEQHKNDISEIDFDAIQTPEYIKANVTLRLLREVEDSVVTKEWNDLFLVPSVNVLSGNDGVGSFKVQKSLLDSLGVTEDELFKWAEDNTEKTCRFQNMLGVLRDLKEEAVETMELDGAEPMYVLSNESRVNGAALMCCRKTQRKLHALYGKCYILPSSIHEVIVITDPNAVTVDELRAMVHEVNETQVVPEERLSENVYVLKQNGVTIA